MDHMGFPDNASEAIAVAENNSNIYLGTTILRFYRRWADNPDEAVPIEVKEAVERLGPERVVFGSNLPEYRPIQVLRAIQRLELGEEAENLIFGENLARLYQLS
jgi:predicted TIM-barrel fold metal-dependent hydrolase